MRKIAIVSDIHGNILALEKVVADIETRQVDGVFNLGDHISGPLYPKETLDFLRKQDWVQLLGNHDRQLISQNPQQHGLSDQYAFSCLNDADLDWLRTLPASTMVENQFFLFHGTPSSDTTYLLETVGHGKAWLATPAEIAQRLDGAMAQIMLCGHTHIPRVVEMAQDILIVNPGSVGLPAYDDETPEYHVMETGSPHARYVILEYKNCNWQVEMISVGYDYQQAAQQARKNGRPDWEYALQTGFMPIKSQA
ncbi:MAG TPA: metallophosphoesterase family protein [Anaerolineales bacterium]|nr:metallophosphoesterase family protein [Anaerolineales bacterium]